MDPVHIVAVIAAAFLHVALQTSAQTLAHWFWTVRPSTDPDVALAFSWTGQWLKIFPMQLNIIDWELITGAAIVGIAHASFYYAETQQRALHEAQLETRLVEAQLQTLQRQLHPHFLFNTLHAISALMHRDVKAADRMLVRAERPAADDARLGRAAGNPPARRDGVPGEVPPDRTGSARRSSYR